MNQEEHNRIVKAGLSKFNFTKPVKKTPIDDLIDKAQQITTAMRAHIRPVLQSGGWKDREAMRQLIMSLYLEAFTKAFDKEALCNLCAILHTEIAIEQIEANPYDSTSGPDALSGV